MLAFIKFILASIVCTLWFWEITTPCWFFLTVGEFFWPFVVLESMIICTNFLVFYVEIKVTILEFFLNYIIISYTVRMIIEENFDPNSKWMVWISERYQPIIALGLCFWFFY